MTAAWNRTLYIVDYILYDSNAGDVNNIKLFVIVLVSKSQFIKSYSFSERNIVTMNSIYFYLLCHFQIILKNEEPFKKLSLL